VRIISGEHKGRKIIAPKKLPVRPTTDMAKESLFNIINNYYYFEDISVLDLFSGTGNISYEFASRGTQLITAVDSHYGCVRFIDETSNKLKMPIRVIKDDVFKFLQTSKQTYDIIFADPPYDFDLEIFSSITDLVFSNTLLNKQGLLILEHSKYMDLSNLNYFMSSKSYGSSVFSFFEKN
jgi:16S rRNA (guanine966-N2)-methyltransferase